jgi:hypothetical protein
MESLQSLDQLQPGQTAQFEAQEGLGLWNISRLHDGQLVLETPEIPISPEERLNTLRGALLENLAGSMPLHHRFCLDDTKTLRMQTMVAAESFDDAVLEIAKTYSGVIDVISHKDTDKEEALDLDALLAESAADDIVAENQDVNILQKLYESLGLDEQLRDLLYIDEGGDRGVIELVEDDVSIALVPNAQTGGVALIYGVYLLSNGKAEEVEMETALWANSILRIGNELLLGCDESFTCLYLCHTLASQDCNPEGLKEGMAVLLMTGNKLIDLLNGEAAPSSRQKDEFKGSMETMLSRGGMQV